MDRNPPVPPREAFAFGGETVPAGHELIVRLPISRMSTGTPVAVPVRVIHGAADGPTVFVSAAIHGDEIIGTEIIRRLRKKLLARHVSGTILLIPVVNIFGFLTHDRYLPDRRDLNRSFPGTSKGSLAAQLANRFARDIISRCMLGIDIHSAAADRYNLPQIRIAGGDPHLLELALAFGAPVVIEAELRSGSMREYARSKGVDMLLLEAGEASRIDEFSVRVGLAGVMRVLAKLGIIADADIPGTAAVSARAKRSFWLRAPMGGVARLHRVSGAQITAGERLGMVGDVLGEKSLPLVSPCDGIIIGHANLPVVNQGDALLHIAEVEQYDSADEAIAAISHSLMNDALLDEDEVV